MTALTKCKPWRGGTVQSARVVCFSMLTCMRRGRANILFLSQGGAQPHQVQA